MVVVMISIVVMAMVAAAIMTVDPMAMRFMAGNPDHFPVAVPIAFAVVIIRAIADVNFQARSIQSCRQGDAGRQSSNNNQFLYGHDTSEIVSGWLCEWVVVDGVADLLVRRTNT